MVASCSAATMGISNMLHALRQLPGLKWGGVVALQVADTKLHLRAVIGFTYVHVVLGL